MEPKVKKKSKPKVEKKPLSSEDQIGITIPPERKHKYVIDTETTSLYGDRQLVQISVIRVISLLEN